MKSDYGPLFLDECRIERTALTPLILNAVAKALDCGEDSYCGIPGDDGGCIIKMSRSSGGDEKKIGLIYRRAVFCEESGEELSVWDYILFIADVIENRVDKLTYKFDTRTRITPACRLFEYLCSIGADHRTFDSAVAGFVELEDS